MLIRLEHRADQAALPSVRYRYSSGSADPQHLRDVSGRDALLPQADAALAASASSTLRGRPPLRPLAAAAASSGAGALDHGVAFELGERRP